MPRAGHNNLCRSAVGRFITARRAYGHAVRGHGGPVAAVPVGVGTGVGVGAGPGDGVAAGGDDIPPVSFTRARGVVCGRAIRVVVAVTTVRAAGCATAGGVGSRDTGAVVTLVRARAAGGEEEFVRRGDSVTVAGAEDDVAVGAIVAEGVGGMGVGVGLVVAGQALTGVGTRGDYSGPLCQDSEADVKTQNADPSPSLKSSPVVASGCVPAYTSAGVR